MAETKEQLVNSIKEWVKLDNDIRKLQKEVSIRKKEKAKISSELMGRTHMVSLTYPVCKSQRKRVSTHQT